jgi:hypothetical protein
MTVLAAYDIPERRPLGRSAASAGAQVIGADRPR